MLFSQILKAFLVGIIASIPVGPIAILVIKNSLSRGHGTGFVTGLGAVFTDTFFALIAIFALAFAQQFIADFGVAISMVGGAIVIAVGIKMALSDPMRKLNMQMKLPKASVKDFFQSLALGLSNPGNIFLMLTLFALFGLGDIPAGDWRVAPIIFALCVGASTYWFFITFLLGKLKNRLDIGKLIWINRITGLMVVILGFILFGDGLFKMLFQGARFVNFS